MMGKLWPYWRDTRNGERYELLLVAGLPDDTPVFVLKHRDGGLNLVSPMLGYPGCVIEKDDDVKVRDDGTV